MGKIDYDVGDLVEVVKDSRLGHLKKGQVFTCLRIGESVNIDTLEPGLGVEIDGPRPPRANIWNARMFRKLPKKSQEFFTGAFHVEPV